MYKRIAIVSAASLAFAAPLVLAAESWRDGPATAPILLSPELIAVSQSEPTSSSSPMPDTSTGTAPIELPDLSLPDVTSRRKCVAPCAVYFDAKSTTSALTTRPFHELLYQWNFGDPVAGGSGACTDGDPVAREAGEGMYCTGALTGTILDSKNYAEGPQAAHVFEMPGMYKVVLTVSQGDKSGNGTLDTDEFKRGSVEIMVTDPNALPTACIANGVKPVAGADRCPAGAKGLYNSSNGASALASALGMNGCGFFTACKRILFRRGDSFTSNGVVTITDDGPGIIGAYGVGKKPVYMSSTSQFRIHGSNWSVVDILQNLNQSGHTNAGIYSEVGGVKNMLMLRVDTRGGQAFKTSGGSLGSSTSGLWDGIFIFDSTCKDPFHSRDNGLNCYYISGTRVAAVGNHIDMDQWSEHGIRTYAQRSVISHNTTEDIARGRSSITQRSLGWRGGGGMPAQQYSGYAIQSQNREIGNGVSGTFNYMHTNQGMIEQCRDVIFERNVATNIVIDTMCDFVTVRNNISRFTTRGGIMVKYTGPDDGAQAFLPTPSPLYIFNNTAISDHSGNVVLYYGRDGSSAPNAIVYLKNNLLYAPNDQKYGDGIATLFATTIDGCATCNTGSKGEIRTDPLLDGFYKPQSGSYAIGRGVAVPVWNDFYGNWQTAIRDIGAVIH